MTDKNAPEATAADTNDSAAAPQSAAPAAVPDASGLPEMPAEATLVKEGTIPAPRPDRELEDAPRLLRIAAFVLLIGALFPFMAAMPFMQGEAWLSFGVAKLVGLLGCLMLGFAVYTRIGQPVPYGLGALGNIRFAPRLMPGQKPKGALAGMLQSVPTALHLVGLVLLVVAVLMPFFDPDIARLVGPYDENSPLYNPAFQGLKPPADAVSAAAEIAALLLAGCTLAHLFAYKKGGQFSPLYPFLFLGPAFMGALSIYSLFPLNGASGAISLLGAAIVSVAAAMGVYTIVVAMIQAKKEGDAKREAALEARKAARKSSGKGGRGSRR
ncbi:hypothetical protein Pla163_23040 [Planctomycetes bacterium Pla163]|uniref:Uncharacterized protein n=1 Tax=Rohdeia mirabilis TaxID=2528008 RepID=A0A518D109_9BACT|nr:hypothetical protein Pla163_23040 [Planctomycetes bacterium Pla163]